MRYWGSSVLWTVWLFHIWHCIHFSYYEIHRHWKITELILWQWINPHCPAPLLCCYSLLKRWQLVVVMWNFLYQMFGPNLEWSMMAVQTFWQWNHMTHSSVDTTLLSVHNVPDMIWNAYKYSEERKKKTFWIFTGSRE